MTEKDILQHLRTKTFGKTIYVFDTIDSTNTFAKSLAQQDFDVGTLVIAEEQTKGRGRFGRSWHSQKEKNLTFSLLIKPTITPKQIGILSLYGGLAVVEAIKKIAHITPDCKWPNDVLLKGKKVCGILSESVVSQNKLAAVILGIGLNVNQTEFPPEIRRTAASLLLSTGKSIDRFQVLSAVLEQLELFYEKIQSGKLNEIIQLWRQHTTMLGKQVTVDQQGKILKGTAKEVADDGGLILRSNGIDIKVLAGDVTIIQ